MLCCTLIDRENWNKKGYARPFHCFKNFVNENYYRKCATTKNYGCSPVRHTSIVHILYYGHRFGFWGIRRLRHHKIPFELCHFFMNSLLKWTWWLRVTSGLIPIWKISFGFFSKFSLDFSTLKFRLDFLGSPVYIEYHSVCDMLECNFIYEFPNIFHWIYMIHAMANASHVWEGGDSFFILLHSANGSHYTERERKRKIDYIFRNVDTVNMSKWIESIFLVGFSAEFI